MIKREVAYTYVIDHYRKGYGFFSSRWREGGGGGAGESILFGYAEDTIL